MQIHIKAADEWVAVPGTQSLENTTVFHYTGASGLLGILQHGCLWASSAAQMNDQSEVLYALDVIREATERRTDKASATVGSYIDDNWADTLRKDTYIASASAEPDLLTQWIHYAGATGYSVGLKVDSDRSLVPYCDDPPPSTEKTQPNRAPIGGWVRVLYERRDQLDAVDALLDMLDTTGLAESRSTQVEHRVSMFFAVLVPQLKHPAFKDEREIRYITTRQEWTTEKHRAGPFGLVPYVELRAGGREDPIGTNSTDRSLPLHSVQVGPTPAGERDSARHAAQRLLSAYKYSVPVDVSEIPYRHPRGS